MHGNNKYPAAALAILLTGSFVACAGVEPSGESGTPEDSASSKPSTPGAPVMRQALTKDPREYSTKELMALGYRPHPDPATMPEAYAAWLEDASKPMKLITPITSESDTDNDRITSHHSWSGIMNNTPAGGYTYVVGQWTVPSVTADPGTDTFSSAWVGLDGWETPGVELWQAGTAQNISADGTPDYYAWFQMFPHEHEQRLNNLEVRPGDVILVAVAIQDDNGNLTNEGQVPKYTITNATTETSTGWQEWGSIGEGQVSGATVEWVMERPTKHGAAATLANYTDIEFDNMTYVDDGGPHNGIDANSHTVDMVNPDDNTTLSQAWQLSDTSAATYFFAPN